MSTDDHGLVAEYLQRLRSAARALPADRAGELIEEITTHIAEARATAPTTPGGSASVRNILERLGDPGDIVGAAAEQLRDDTAAAPRVPGYAGPGSPASGPARAGLAGRRWPGTATGRAGAGEIVTVILLLIGGIVLPVIGWVIGIVLLWASPRWSRSDKLLGTLVWPGGLLAPLALLVVNGFAALVTASVTVCQGGRPEVAGTTATGQVTGIHNATAAACAGPAGPPGWLVIGIAVLLMAAAIAGPVFTAIRLLRRAARPAAEPTADPTALQAV